jgi:hypothetical protein
VPRVIAVPRVGNVEFPDGMSDDQIRAALLRHVPAGLAFSTDDPRWIENVTRNEDRMALFSGQEQAFRSNVSNPEQPGFMDSLRLANAQSAHEDMQMYAKRAMIARRSLGRRVDANGNPITGSEAAGTLPPPPQPQALAQQP